MQYAAHTPVSQRLRRDTDQQHVRPWLCSRGSAGGVEALGESRKRRKDEGRCALRGRRVVRAVSRQFPQSTRVSELPLRFSRGSRLFPAADTVPLMPSSASTGGGRGNRRHQHRRGTPQSYTHPLLSPCSSVGDSPETGPPCVALSFCRRPTNPSSTDTAAEEEQARRQQGERERQEGRRTGMRTMRSYGLRVVWLRCPYRRAPLASSPSIPFLLCRRGHSP
jgi:hypothetical protein